jgi:hypothetical protein
MQDEPRGPDRAEAPPDGLDQLAAAGVLDAESEPVLGPVGRRLVILVVVMLALLLIVLTVWLLGYIAYTTPPIPGGG